MHEVMKQLMGYARGIWHYRWYAVVVAWVVGIAGWIVVWMLPDRFEATARVYVDTQSVLKPLLAGLTVQPNVEQQIVMMSRTLISRPNLERVIRMSDMDIKLKTTEDKESLIDRLAKDIKLGSAGRDNLYAISYSDTKPEDAKRVVQSLLTIFVEGSLGDKRKDADSAKRFLDEQIKVYEQKLVAAENSLKEFKRQNMGMMPSEGKDYVARLQAASARLSQARLELREAEHARDALRKQLAGEEPVFLAEESQQGSGTSPGTPSQAALPKEVQELDARIAQLRQKLDQLRTSFTDAHPDIRSTRRVIEQLEDQRKQEIAKIKKPEPVAPGAPAPARSAMTQQRNPVLQQLTVALAETEATVAALRTRVAEYESQFNELRAAANKVPEIETDLVQLNRDYEVNKANYEKLLARRESAQMSGEMESNAGVLDFRIVDPPRVPPTPSSPKRGVLMTAVLLGALGAGLGIAFVISQVRPVFYDRQTLQDITGLPILGAVAMKWTDQQRRVRRRGLMALAVSLGGLLGSYGAVMTLLTITGRV